MGRSKRASPLVREGTFQPSGQRFVVGEACVSHEEWAQSVDVEALVDGKLAGLRRAMLDRLLQRGWSLKEA